MTIEEIRNLTTRTNIRDWRKMSVFVIEVGVRGRTLRADIRAIAEDELTARQIIERLADNLPASSRLYAEPYDATTGVRTLANAAEHALLLYKLEMAQSAK